MPYDMTKMTGNIPTELYNAVPLESCPGNDEETLVMELLRNVADNRLAYALIEQMHPSLLFLDFTNSEGNSARSVAKELYPENEALHDLIDRKVTLLQQERAEIVARRAERMAARELRWQSAAPGVNRGWKNARSTLLLLSVARNMSESLRSGQSMDVGDGAGAAAVEDPTVVLATAFDQARLENGHGMNPGSARPSARPSPFKSTKRPGNR